MYVEFELDTESVDAVVAELFYDGYVAISWNPETRAYDIIPTGKMLARAGVKLVGVKKK